MEFTASALVVEPDLRNLLLVLSTLSTLGVDATVAENFRDAKSVIATTRPALLLTSVKLHEFNGLHLVMRGRAAWPHLPSIVTTGMDDVVLRREAEELGATFIALPISSEEMAAAICRTTLCVDGRVRIRAPFERRIKQRRLAATSQAVERRAGDRRQSFTMSLRHLVAGPAE
jgi:DNA-binding NtrC family response regulator